MFSGFGALYIFDSTQSLKLAIRRVTRDKNTLYFTNVYITKVLQYIIYRSAVDDL